MNVPKQYCKSLSYSNACICGGTVNMQMYAYVLIVPKYSLDCGVEKLWNVGRQRVCFGNFGGEGDNKLIKHNLIIHSQGDDDDAFALPFVCLYSISLNTQTANRSSPHRISQGCLKSSAYVFKPLECIKLVAIKVFSATYIFSCRKSAFS